MNRVLPLVLAASFLGALPAAAQPAAAQAAAPEIAFDSVANALTLPDDIYLGEIGGVATNSKGNIFVYTRTGHPTLTLGAARGFAHGGSRLFEFDRNGKYRPRDRQGQLRLHVRPAGPHRSAGQHLGGRPDDQLGHQVRSGGTGADDPGPQGRGGPVPARAPAAPAAPAAGQVAGAGDPTDLFNRPTDVAWDGAGNIYVADGIGNQRVAKFDKNGVFIKSWGSRGTEPGQFGTARAIAVDAQDNVYVADPRNNRIQVFDSDGNFKTQITSVGAPQALCITPGPHQVLYSSNSNRLRTSTPAAKSTSSSSTARWSASSAAPGACRRSSTSSMPSTAATRTSLYVGEIGNLRVQKLALH